MRRRGKGWWSLWRRDWEKVGEMTWVADGTGTYVERASAWEKAGRRKENRGGIFVRGGEHGEG